MKGSAGSLQARLLVLVVGLVATVWLATALITWFDVRNEIDELLDSHLAQAASMLVARQIHPEDDREHGGEEAPIANRYARKVAFQVFHEGRLVQRSATAPLSPMSGEAAGKFRTGFETVLIDRISWRVYAAYGGDNDVQVYVGERVGSRSAIVRAALRSMLWPMLLALPLLAFAAWWAVRRGVAPLRRLGHMLAQREPRSLHAVRVEGAPSEMAPMLDALNDLFARIGALMETERRFTADAAHELRTPIAAIRTQAQVALAQDNEAGRRHALEATLHGCERASRLVDQLLTLSRVEGGDAPAMEPLDLGALVRDAVAGLVPAAMQMQQQVELDATPACLVQGDAVLLSVLMRNLVDNASRYSPPGARIQVTVARREPGGVELRVEDSGPGMADADLQRFGERFFRVLGTTHPGSGLGGSIVRRIASVHGADVRVGRSKALGGLEVAVTWGGRG